MSQHESCTYAGREEDLAGYLYRELSDAERARVETHLETCEACREELAGLEHVRIPLAEWIPPEPVRPLNNVVIPPSRWRRWATLAEVPAWAQAAAAVLVLGAAAGAANLEIRYTEDGLSVRTGWAHPQATSGPPPSAEQPWKAELTRLEAEMREQLNAVRAAAPAAEVRADVPSPVRALVEESERRQRLELALRVAQVLQDVETQRRADHEAIEYNLGMVGARVMDLNDYMLRVSQQGR
jgi:hypothetical protein